MNKDLSKFTDVIDEICDSQPLEICDSQPLSLTSSNNTPVPQEDPLPKSYRPEKCTGQSGNFRSVEEIDPKYQHVFAYRYFNIVQSGVIEDALYSNKSIVVCAPTGSGKTVVFEMAIVQLLMELEDRNYTGDFKIIYMAPVKALCTERLTEWHSKFTRLGLLCIEVTGDTDVEFPQLQPYRIIITTPEKWDMLTRRWKDHRGLVEVVKLFLIDEVHILNDEIRGPVLEAVVSRMKTIETSVQSAHRIEQLQAQFQGAGVQRQESPPRIRFVAVSATVSNPEDVAAWLGSSEQPAAYYKFGDECRPVKLKRVVEGYPCPVGTSIFKFDIILNYKLLPIIQKYHNGKPTLIFCNTRKGVALTAETLSREMTISFNAEQKAELVALASTLKNKKVQSLVLCGVGCHHAGLLYEERTNIEQAFRNRDLPILVTTTTLAMGVNLPAHLVIIKNTQQYVNGAYQEYSISTVLQMVGRAGRPQYDTEATAVIMTRLQDKTRYQALVGGCEALQSYLHKRLAENLNSEAALGTVGDVAQCVQWVNSTFFSVRAARDPKRYLSLPPAAPAELISKKIEELCVRAMNGLASAGLITMDELSCIESTEAGRLMSLYYLDLETMKLIMKLDGTEGLERLLWLVCESHELADMHLRVDERRCLNALNRNSAAATIRFPMKGKINSRQMKLSCVIQAVLGCLPIPDPSLNQEAMKIMRVADRVCKCLVSYVTRPNLISQNPKFYSTILNSLVLAKCISAHLWENSPYVCRQLKGIGPTYSTLLASAGKTNFMVLEESHPRDLERIMNKGPPAGNLLRKQISLLPKYNLTMTPVSERIVRIQLLLMNQAHLAENMENLTAGANHKSYVVVGDSENYLLYFKAFKESDLISVYDGSMAFEITRKHTDEHKVFAHCISSTLVGIDEKCEYTFVDINPLPEINVTDNNISIHETLENPHHMHQTTITDVFKQRKRKLFNENDIIQCKEKRKRDNKLMNTLKSLKESLEKSSDEIKVGFTTKSDISNNLQNLTKTNLPLNEKIVTTISLNHVKDDQYENQSLENAFSEDFEMENLDIDEQEIEGILGEIEDEIKYRKPINSVGLKAEPKPSKQNQFANFHKSDPVKYNYKRQAESYKNMHTSAIRRKLNTKNNYTFLEMLEKKDSKDNSYTTKIESGTGFSETVKSQIEKYLQQAQNKIEIKNPILVNMVDTSNTKVKGISPTDSTDLTKDESESLQNSKTETDNNDQSMNSVVMYEKNHHLDAKVDQFYENPKDSVDLTIDESQICENKTNSSDQIRNSIDSEENQLQFNAEKETSVSFNSPIQQNEINLRSSTNLTPRQCLKIMPCNQATNKFAEPSELQEQNSKEIILKNTNQMVMEKRQNENKKYSVTNLLPRFNATPSNELPISFNKNEVQITVPLNNPPSFDEKELILENPNNFHTHGDNNNYHYSESNTSEMPTSEENIEKINTYSFGQTEKFNICTENSRKQKVQIISNLKVDFDITEIVYKRDKLSPKSNEVDTNTKYNENPKIFTRGAADFEISDKDSCNKITTLQNSTYKRLQLNPCMSDEVKRNSNFVQTIKSNKDLKGSYLKMNNFENSLPLQNDDKYCNKDIISRDNKENTSVMDGLQKYGNTIKRQNNSIYEIQKFYRGSSCDSQNPNIAKSSRKHKIIDRDNAPSHQSLTVAKENNVLQKAIARRDNLLEKATSENDCEIKEKTRSLNKQIQNYSTESESFHFNIGQNIEEESQQIRTLRDKLSQLNPTFDYDINQSSDKIIPPPPEYCDDNTTNSSTFSDNYFYDQKLKPENTPDKRFAFLNNPNLSKKANITLDKIKNIESISDCNETMPDVNNAHDDKDTMLSKDKSINVSVKDILQKYSNTFKMQKPSSTNNKFETKINKCESSDNSTTLIMAKNTRKCKIRDIDKIQIPLPQSLIVENNNTGSQKIMTQQHNTASQNWIAQRDNMNAEAAYAKHCEIQPQNDDNKQIKDYSISESDINIEHDTVEEVLKTLSPDDDYNINQTILNPKTLLECMNKVDKDKITMSPPRFYEDNDDNTSTYSPTYISENQNAEDTTTQGYKDCTQNDFVTFETTNVFDNNNDSVINLTPSKEVETWTLSQESVHNRLYDSDMLSSCRSSNTYTILRKNCTENNSGSHKCAYNPRNSRQTKLSYFKFERKRLYKKI
ncbi:probable ATP-dependent DNA helicase HFM1 [Maniola jurtina]|uniref:probable ATP-dependent DNA helicase HFM1 n=1 Tax=Maniola jurtina TaxID=191418 RepID=UPI001E68DA69|nr:probable ATP-dependent DNA helicase HFM1 [Maniola jurtina]